jgi:hypothetical protein
VADYIASAGAYGNNCKLVWSLDFDDVANAVAITATHTHFDDSPAPDPQQAVLTFTLNTSQSIDLDLLTGLLSQGGAFDGTATAIINSGTRTRTGVKLKISADRAKLITFSTAYLPPA